jgi:DNA-binding NtrC family response regulator
MERKESLERSKGTAKAYFDRHAPQDPDSRERLRREATGAHCQPSEAGVGEMSGAGGGGSKQGPCGIGRTLEMQKLDHIIGRAAESMHPVLIVGESGTGKGMAARCIHYSSPSRDKPFIPIDCGSVVPALIECALFGYIKRTLTGSNQPQDSLTAIAEGGTVFLEEVGELPADLQAKLLRAIQEKEIRTVGRTRGALINVRIMAATNRDLEQAVTHGKFRRDLYIHLSLLSLRIPPLRERRQDIPPLIAHFLDRIVRNSGQEKVFSGEALKAMIVHDWPGNVRQLENCVERTCALSRGSLIHTADLPPEIANFPKPEASTGKAPPRKIIRIAELEKQTILNAVAELNGDKLQAARLLGIGKTTLYRKLKHYESQSGPRGGPATLHRRYIGTQDCQYKGWT